jgi:hypothetical protein
VLNEIQISLICNKNKKRYYENEEVKKITTLILLKNSSTDISSAFDLSIIFKKSINLKFLSPKYFESLIIDSSSGSKTQIFTFQKRIKEFFHNING